MRHDVGSLCGNTETFGNCHKYALIPHPLTRVDTHKLADRFSVLLRFCRILSHRSVEQIDIFDVAVGFCNPRSNRSRHTSNSVHRHTAFRPKIDIAVCGSVVAVGKTVCVTNQPPDICRELTESRGNTIELSHQRRESGRQPLNLLGKGVPVNSVEGLCQLRELVQLRNCRLQPGRSAQTVQRSKGSREPTQPGEIRSPQRGHSTPDVPQLITDTGRNLDTPHPRELGETVRQPVDFISRGTVHSLKGGIKVA